MSDLIEELSKMWELTDGWYISKVETFPMYHSGWEMDEIGYHVYFSDTSGEVVESSLVFTNHGSFRHVTKDKAEEYLLTLEKAVTDMRERMKKVTFE